MDTYFNPSIIETELQTYLQEHLTGGVCAVSEANLDDDRPAVSTPYVTYNLISQAGEDENLYEISRTYNEEDKTFDILYENYPTVIVSINCMHNTRITAQTLAVLCRTFFQEDGKSFLDTNNLVCVELTPTLNRTVYLINNYLYQFGFDVTLRTKQSLTKTIEVIETIEANVNNEDITIILGDLG